MTSPSTGSFKITIYSGPSRFTRLPCQFVRIIDGPKAPLALAELRRRIQHLATPDAPWRELLAGIDGLGADDRMMHYGDLAGELALIIQENHFHIPLTYHLSTDPKNDDDLLVVESHEPGITEPCTRMGLSIAGVVFSFEAENALKSYAETQSASLTQVVTHRSRHRYFATTRAILDAAWRRGIPTHRPMADVVMMVLGHGKKRIRLMGTEADTSSSVAVNVLEGDKVFTRQMLTDAGLPMPHQIAAHSRITFDKAVESIGFPLVVKGRRGGRGETVTANITRPEDLDAAYKRATHQGAPPIVERFVKGDDHRLLVVNCRLVAAVRRNPAMIDGDGIHTIRQLIALEIERRKKVFPHSWWTCPLKIDTDMKRVLAQASLTPESVPGKGEIIRLRNVASISQGGLPSDVLPVLHPTIKAMAERAARIIGLDIAGVDYITTDITRPPHETGGAFIEINSYPGLDMHYMAVPSSDVAGDILDYLYPDGDDGRIPIAAVTGSNGKTTVVHMLSTILRNAGLVTASSTTVEARIDDDIIAQGDVAGGRVAQMMLRDPAVEAGVFEMARGGLLKGGSRLDRWSVGVVTNLAEEHLGLDGIDTIEEMATVKRLIAELASDAVVLNADDPHCIAMVPHVSAPVWWFSLDAENALIQEHLEAGGHALLAMEKDGQEHMVWRHGQKMTVIAALADLPATFGGTARFNVENALAAAAAALALGQPLDVVAEGLKRFETTFEASPGRMNMRKAHGVTMISDYGHNPHGLAKVIDFLKRQDCSGRRHFAFIRAGDRQSNSFIGEAAVLAGHFDRYYFATDMRKVIRDTAPVTTDDMVTSLLVEGVDPRSVQGFPGPQETLDAIFDALKPGDLVYIMSIMQDETWARIQNYAGPNTEKQRSKHSS